MCYSTNRQFAIECRPLNFHIQNRVAKEKRMVFCIKSDGNQMYIVFVVKCLKDIHPHWLSNQIKCVIEDRNNGVRVIPFLYVMYINSASFRPKHLAITSIIFFCQPQQKEEVFPCCFTSSFSFVCWVTNPFGKFAKFV